ncbi:MAG: ATP-binding cassette domain-containing protein, partial [Anaerolineaceae bacterium]
MIKVSKLTKDYGARRAIDNLTFKAERGEIIGFLGPNGAGKTTTMRILSGYMPPTSGKAEIGGFDVVDQSLEVRKIVGYLPETVPLYQDMTVFEFLKYKADLHHIPNAEERVDEVIEMVDLIDRADGYISALSKGMRQRVGIGQALLHKPEVLILDEPTIGLDPAQIIEVRNLIKRIGKERTVMLSTYILSEAQQVCDRVLIINKGHIVAEDTPERLQSRLSGSQRVELKLRKGVEDALTLIKKVRGVTSVSVKDDNLLEFEMSANQDIRPNVAKAVIQGGFDLLEMKQNTLSLEDIFLELTRDETPRPALKD